MKESNQGPLHRESPALSLDQSCYNQMRIIVHLPNFFWANLILIVGKCITWTEIKKLGKLKNFEFFRVDLSLSLYVKLELKLQIETRQWHSNFSSFKLKYFEFFEFKVRSRTTKYINISSKAQKTQNIWVWNKVFSFTHNNYVSIQFLSFFEL